MTEESDRLPPGSRKWLELAAPVYFITITVWLTWPLIARLGTGLNASADPLLNFWALGWNFHILPQAPLDYFNANIFAPRPDTLAYSEHLFGIAILVWPAFLLTGNLITAYNTVVFGSFFLSGLGMYLLVRDLSGSRWGGLIAGTIFLAAPYRFLHLLHIQLLVYCWFPFVFWSLLRFLRDGKTRQLVGVVVFSLLQLLSCNYYAVYLAFAMMVFGVTLLAIGRAALTTRKLVSLGAGAVTVALFTLPFIRPYQRNEEQGFYRRYEDVAHFAARPTDYLRPSTFNKAPYVRWLPRQVQSEKALFPGFLAIALGLAGAIAGARLTKGSPERRLPWLFFTLLGSLAFVLSLGPEVAWGDSVQRLPYYFFYRHVPGFNGMRVPARISVLALFSLTTLAGLGASWLLHRFRRFEKTIGVAALAILLFEYQTYSLDRVLAPPPSIPAVYQWLGEQPAQGERDAVLVLPIYEGEEIIDESARMYGSTVHWKPLVNGFSGWWPNDYWELVGRLRAFPTSRSLRFLLERAPVRYVVIHYDAIPQPRRRHLEEAMYRYREIMPLRVRVGNDVVHEILDRDSPSS